MLFGSRSLDDPAARRVVDALAAVGDGRSTVVLPTMGDTFRADLRAQLVAVAPRLVEEGVRPGTETVVGTAASTATVAADRPATARPAARTRPMTVLLTGAAVVVLGLGGATWLARGALPGDALYGLKRTAESVDVSLSGSDLDKGHAQLVDAQKRVEEVDALLQRPQAMGVSAPSAGGYSAADALSDSTVRLVVSTLESADSDTHSGITTIGDDAVSRGAASGLQLVVAWAQGQRDRIDALVTRLPQGPAHDQAATSAAEIRTGLQRASDLLGDYTDTACRRDRDAFGPTPCVAAAPATQPSTTTTAPTAPTTTGGSGATTGGAPASTSAPPSAAPSSPAASGPLPGGLPAGTPTLPTTLPPPVTVDTCGIQVSLPVANVSLGTCAPTR